MPKSHSPVRLEASLMESASLAGHVFKRSAVEQIEYWASIGRLIAPKMTPDQILELQAGMVKLKIEKATPVHIDSDGLLGEIDRKRSSGALQRSISNHSLRYQACSSNPGYLEQVSADGHVSIGLFRNGKFEAIQ